MTTRMSVLLAGLVLAGSVYAADKPAAQARQNMEGERTSPAIVEHRGSFSSFSGASSATKPAVAARMQREAEATEMAAKKHPVRDVGYTKGESYVAPRTPSTTKPAVEARQAMEH